jgi:hypothetical protein
MNRSGFEEDGSELPQRLEESLEQMEKSSQLLEELLALLSVFSQNGFGSKSVLGESIHDVFPSKPVASASRDARSESKARRQVLLDVRQELLAAMAKSFERLFWARACHSQLKRSL